MPDIAMCNIDKCPLSAACYRHADSGATPTDYQTYFDFNENDGSAFEVATSRCGYFIAANNLALPFDAEGPQT